MSHSAFVQNDAVMLQTASNCKAQVLGLDSKTKGTVLLWAGNCKKWDKALEILAIYTTETYIFKRKQ